jgi:hypothetical protein
MLRYLFLFLLSSLLFVAGAARAQRALVQEFAGSTVLLTNGDTLHGPLTLRRDQDVLLMAQPDGTLTTLSAVSVNSFAVKGEQVDNRRNAGYYDNFYDARNGYYYGSPLYNRPFPRSRPELEDVNRVRVFRTFRWNRGNDYSDFKSPASFLILNSSFHHRSRLRRTT